MTTAEVERLSRAIDRLDARIADQDSRMVRVETLLEQMAAREGRRFSLVSLLTTAAASGLAGALTTILVHHP